MHLPRGVKRELAADELKGVRVVAMNVKRLAAAQKSDSSFAQGVNARGTQGLVRWVQTSPFAHRTSMLVSPADGQLPADTKVRSSKYLNNLIEQDHRGVKLRIGAMLGFKWFTTAAIVIAGIELLRWIHKGQIDLGGLRLKDRSTPGVWNAVLAA